MKYNKLQKYKTVSMSFEFMQKKWLFFLAFLFFSCPLFASSANANDPFQFAVIAQPAKSTDIHWENQIHAINSASPAFAVVNGLRANDEPCSDELYDERKYLFNTSKPPLFFSLAGNDWIGCKNRNGDDIRIERLQRLREILSDTETAFGISEMPLVRQSHSSRHLDFPENTFWQYNSVFFITLNLPSENNHYLNAAGRNNEFEERLLANQRWLKRSFILAKRHNLKGIVIFCDGNPFRKMPLRDGFRETRQLIRKLAQKFSGKVLIIYGHTTSETKPAIYWENNLGSTSARTEWLTISVDPKNANLFSIRNRTPLSER